MLDPAFQYGGMEHPSAIFFPLNWPRATLDGHQTATAAAIVERYLAERLDPAPRRRTHALQAADGLLRAARIVDGYR